MSRQRIPLLGIGFYNRTARVKANLRHKDTFLDYHGRVRYARAFKAGDIVRIPIEHINRVRKQK